MNSSEAVVATLRGLGEAGVPHLLTGGLAANVYGFSRATKDADIVIEMQLPGFDDFARQLPADLVLNPQVTFETITGSHRHIIALRHSAFRIELFLLGQDPHHRARFERRIERLIPALKITAWIATAEDMVIQKVRWNRDKDREDARNILAVQGDALEFAYIEHWCDAHGTRERLEKLRRSIPPI